MSEQRRLTDELTALAAQTSWPPTPDLANRLELDAGTPPRRTGRRRALGALVAGALLAVGAAAEPVRSAVEDVLGIGGTTRVERATRPPDATLPPLDLGQRATLAEIRRNVTFPLEVPGALGRPEEVRYSEQIAGGAVTLRYRRFALTLIEGTADPSLVKFAGPDTHVTGVSVGDGPAFFIRGTHEVALVDRRGFPITGSRRFEPANVLVFQQGSVAYRLQTRLGLARALAIARSVAAGGTPGERNGAGLGR